MLLRGIALIDGCDIWNMDETFHFPYSAFVFKESASKVFKWQQLIVEAN